MHVVQVVGARPQFIKLAPVSAALAAAGHVEAILHTGQHFDDAMSRVFFDELGIPAPAANLDVHSLPHGAMTGRMLEALERELVARRPDAVIVYGDTDSTLAGALAAVKLGLPCAHVEAGLRSFNRAMPEELNRVAADALCDLLLTPTDEGLANLQREGLGARSRKVGDVMFDAFRLFSARGEAKGVVERLGLARGGYVVCTLHRAATTDEPGVLAAVLAALDRVARGGLPVVLPLHPRTRGALERQGLSTGAVRVVPPVSYLEMVGLLRGARGVATDSGGLQKEAYFAGRPCVTLRAETEWTETVACGANVLVGTDAQAIVTALAGLDAQARTARFGLPFYGDGRAAPAIVAALEALRATAR